MDPNHPKAAYSPTRRYQTDVTDEEWRVITPHLPNLRDGPAARLADARDHQRNLLCDAIWLPVAPAAKRLAAVEHDLSLVREVP